MKAVAENAEVLLGKVVFTVEIFESKPTVIRVGRSLIDTATPSTSRRRQAPPVELMTALEAYARRVVGAEKGRTRRG